MPEITVLQALEGGLAQVRRGWTQGTYCDDDGNVCSMGGIETAVPHWLLAVRIGAAEALRKVLAEQYPDWYARSQGGGGGELGPECTITRWNDFPGRTQAEVEAAFEKAIAQEAEHG